MALLGFALSATGFICLIPAACPHTLPISYLTIVPDTEYVHLELTFNPFELNFYSELDWDKNGRLNPVEWEEHEREITRLVLGGLTLRADGKVIQPEVAGTTLHRDSHHATLRAHYRVSQPKQTFTVQSTLATLTSGSHFTQVTYGRGDQAQAARLDLFNASATFQPATIGRTAPETGATLTPSTGTRPGNRAGLSSSPKPYPASPLSASESELVWAGLIVMVALPVLAWGLAMTRYARRKARCPMKPGPGLPEAATSKLSRML